MIIFSHKLQIMWYIKIYWQINSEPVIIISKYNIVICKLCQTVISNNKTSIVSN